MKTSTKTAAPEAPADDPLAGVLVRAAAAADDALVGEWLEALGRRGESAHGGGAERRDVPRAPK